MNATKESAPIHPDLVRQRKRRSERVARAWQEHGAAIGRTFQHLALCDGVKLGAAYLLTIGRQRFPAIRYTQVVPIQAGCPAYDRGEREHTREALYVLGELPPSYVHNPGSMRASGLHYAFDAMSETPADTGAGTAGVWHVAGHLGRADMEHADRGTVSPNWRDAHPRDASGEVYANFLLFKTSETRWQAPLGLKILTGLADKL